MSFELSDVILGCGLERGGRRAVLEALAYFADQETGLARVSHVRLAQRAALSERQVYRALGDLLADARLDGLVRCVRRTRGRGQVAVYRLDIARLEPLKSALNAAGRRVFAGVAKALIDAGLAGRDASPENIRAVFDALGRLLGEEGELTTRRTVEALRAEFELAMQRQADMAVIGRPLATGEAACVPPEPAGKTGQDVRFSEGRKPDTVTEKPDMVSTAHSIESSPSGNLNTAHANAACGTILAGAAVSREAFLFATEGLLAHATVNRRERLQLVEDLQGRLARVTRDGVLAIRVRTEAEAEALAARWLEPLLGWAADVGLAGVVFDRDVPEPPPAPAAVEG